MIFGQMDSICAPRPDVSRAGSNTVVTLLGTAPTAPSYQETTTHPPEENSCSRPRGSEGTGKVGGHPGRGAIPGTHVWTPPSCPTNMCNKAILICSGGSSGVWPGSGHPENEALSCTAQQKSSNKPEVRGARRWDFQLFSLGNSWVVNSLPHPSAFQSGVVFIISLATSHNQLHAFQVQKPKPI